MSRSKWKTNYNINTEVYKTGSLNFSQNMKLYSRNLKITNEYLGYTFLIYTGMLFKKITIEKNMLGFKLGEFVPTRIKPRLNKKLKNKKKR